MNVLVTVVALAALAFWWFAVYNRLLRLRDRVKKAWSALEQKQEDETLRNQYNAHVKIYNDALDAFPANVIALLAGFKTARSFKSAI